MMFVVVKGKEGEEGGKGGRKEGSWRRKDMRMVVGQGEGRGEDKLKRTRKREDTGLE